MRLAAFITVLLSFLGCAQSAKLLPPSSIQTLSFVQSWQLHHGDKVQTFMVAVDVSQLTTKLIFLSDFGERFATIEVDSAGNTKISTTLLSMQYMKAGTLLQFFEYTFYPLASFKSTNINIVSEGRRRLIHDRNRSVIIDYSLDCPWGTPQILVKVSPNITIKIVSQLIENGGDIDLLCTNTSY